MTFGGYWMGIKQLVRLYLNFRFSQKSFGAGQDPMSETGRLFGLDLGRHPGFCWGWGLCGIAAGCGLDRCNAVGDNNPMLICTSPILPEKGGLLTNINNHNK